MIGKTISAIAPGRGWMAGGMGAQKSRELQERFQCRKAGIPNCYAVTPSISFRSRLDGS